MNALLSMTLVIIAYIFGSFNGAYYVGKLKSGSDIRELGSTNAGARNAGRVFGKTAFVYTLLLDAVKTAIPIGTVLLMNGPDWLLGSTALAVLAGHIWPFQLQWRGGKGIVVYLASALLLVPFALLVASCVFF
ncbi:glycerol-3-phosphate acyltransferase [Planococcus lenghuensis]|uniref:glycerol-3-phosphate acyltransferase n=1 Tax=Planococcus lenghuensis TaxID=2213202 RepID=UPI0012EBE739|nr:glycerol-3-phosphate acyltransferase [Planococcus lenghuensis]